MDLKHYLAACTADVNAALESFLPSETDRPETIHKAMRHSVFAGGKRLRPVLCIAAAEACGGSRADALPTAIAVELMHTYSLVHDDLPAMDDDDLRRGRPTCHKVFGEGIAVLAGDALLTAAFLALADAPENGGHKTRDFLTVLAVSGGSQRLIGGQVLDLEGEGRALSVAELTAIHENKTAALLCASLRLGAMSAGTGAENLAMLTRFGRDLGLAFQIIDDILDVTQTSENLGKTAGKDAAAEKATFPATCGLAESRAEAKRLTAAAMEALEPFAGDASRLREIAAYLLCREF